MFVRSHSQTALVPYPTAKTWPYFAQNRFSNRVTKLMAECCEYHEESIVKTQKSHPREWVDVSIPTYHMRARPSENPTHGSEWTVQIQLKLRVNLKSLSAGERSDLNNPPTSVGGILKFSEHRFVG